MLRYPSARLLLFTEALSLIRLKVLYVQEPILPMVHWLFKGDNRLGVSQL